MTVGERIARRREELGWTMDYLAERIGVTKSTINKYEKDQIDMKVSTLRALHDVLEISYLELLDDDNSSEEYELLSSYFRCSREIKNAARAVLNLQKIEKTPAHSGSAV